mgnify:CR=1 FL=1
MKRYLPLVAVLSLLLLTACGRRLPSEEELAAMAAANERPTETSIVQNSSTDNPAPQAAGMTAEEVQNRVVSNPGSVSTGTAALIASSSNLTDSTLTSLVELADATNGEQLFNAATETGFSCLDCHVTDAETDTLGPHLYGIPYIAAQRVEGYTAERYLYTSIIASNAHLTSGFPENLHPQNYLDIYTANEIFDMVAYMMTLENAEIVGTEVEPAIGNLPVDLASAPEMSEPEMSGETVVDAAPEAEAETATSETADSATAEPEVVEEQAAEPQDQIATFVSFANASNGEQLFNQMTDTGFSCANCHSPNSHTRLVGPGLLGIPQVAADRQPDQSAELYLYNSIVHPNEYIVADYTENLMPATYTEVFNSAQIYDLVAYLMTLSE